MRLFDDALDPCAEKQLVHSGRTSRRERTPIFPSSGGLAVWRSPAPIAHLAVPHGYDVVLSNSRAPETLRARALVAELGEKARAATPLEAAQAGEIVVVTIPLKSYRSVPVAPLVGKIVIDTNNYYPARDGHIPELDDESTTNSELLQAHLLQSRVVKAFNHIHAAQLTTDGKPTGAKDRRGLVIAADDAAAKAAVTHLLGQFGFDTVDAGAPSEGWRIQRDTPGYGPRLVSTPTTEAAGEIWLGKRARTKPPAA